MGFDEIVNSLRKALFGDKGRTTTVMSINNLKDGRLGGDLWEIDRDGKLDYITEREVRRDQIQKTHGDKANLIKKEDTPISHGELAQYGTVNITKLNGKRVYTLETKQRKSRVIYQQGKTAQTNRYAVVFDQFLSEIKKYSREHGLKDLLCTPNTLEELISLDNEPTQKLIKKLKQLEIEQNADLVKAINLVEKDYQEFKQSLMISVLTYHLLNNLEANSPEQRKDVTSLKENKEMIFVGSVFQQIGKYQEFKNIRMHTISNRVIVDLAAGFGKYKGTYLVSRAQNLLRIRPAFYKLNATEPEITESIDYEKMLQTMNQVEYKSCPEIAKIVIQYHRFKNNYETLQKVPETNTMEIAPMLNGKGSHLQTRIVNSALEPFMILKDLLAYDKDFIPSTAEAFLKTYLKLDIENLETRMNYTLDDIYTKIGRALEK